MLGLYYTTRLFTRVLPPFVFYSMVKGFGALLYYSRPRVRRDLQAKITDAIPEIKDPRELDRIGIGAYCNVLFPAADFIYFRRRTEQFMRGLEIEGMENLEKADAQGKGVLIHMTHTGLSPLMHAIMARLDKPFTLVMWHPDTTPVARYSMKMVLEGWALGCDPDNLVIWVGPGYDTVGEVRDCLTKGKRVGVPFDVSGKSLVDLFGRPAALADGMGHWAFEFGAPIVPAVVLRTKHTYRNRVIIHEPLSYEPTGNRRADVEAIMKEVARAGERMIREAPEQWLSWFGLWQWWAQARELEEKQDGRGEAG
jgi:KDO2-lipid IV(A) lauroyltransferase